MTAPGDLVAAEIAARGPVSFARFMELALYAPGTGYYTRAEARVGRAGDFVTSPALAPAFGRTLAALLPRVAEATGAAASDLRVVDAGAGEGGLLASMVAGARRLGLDPQRLEWVLVERGPGLRARARERLRAEGVEPVALGAAEELAGLTPRPGVVVANELFDALPARRLRRTDEAVEEAFVDVQQGRLVERWRPAADAPDGLPRGREVAIAVGAGPLLALLAAAVTSGLVLVVDYGQPAAVLLDPEGPGSPLRGFRGGALVDDLLARPGETDLTAHVDFTALARAAEALRVEVVLYTEQLYLLLALGFLDDPQAAASRRLVHPEDMGGAFKCLGLVKGCRPGPFTALAVRDRRRWLA